MQLCAEQLEAEVHHGAGWKSHHGLIRSLFLITVRGLRVTFCSERFVKF